MKTGDKAYSLDDERFYEFDSIMDELDDEHLPGTEVEVQEGTVVEMRHKNFFRLETFVDAAQDEAYGEYDDLADKYLLDLEKEKFEELEMLILKWLDENVKQPTFFGIKDIKTITVTVE